MIHTMHPLHGVAIGLVLYYSGITGMQTSMIIGAGSAAYMMMYGHPF